MRRTLRVLCVIGLVAAFLAMGTAMVLPHSHLHKHDADTHAHACWVCQAKAVGVSSPEAGPKLVVLHQTAFVPPARQAVLHLQQNLFLPEARAPPLSLPVSP